MSAANLYLRDMNNTDQAAIRRIVYASAATGDHDTGAILHQSRANNGVNGVTGLLYADGCRYLQILEGTPEAVEHVFARIGSDPRHHAVDVLTDEVIDERLFGDWAMASLPDEGDELVRARLAILLRSAPEPVRTLFATAA